MTHTTMFMRGLARRLPHRPIRRWAHTPAGLQFSSVTEEDVAHFSKILPSASILSTLAPISTPASELSIFNNDWMNKYHGKSSTVLRPRTAKEVSEIVKWCNERRIPVVPQGGNTGLVGGGVPINDELILSLGNMTNVRSFDPTSGEPSPYGIIAALQFELSCRYHCSRCWLYPGGLVGIPSTT